MASIQFRNRESVLNYYNSLKIDTWAIWHEKDKCFSRGTGGDDLDEALTILEDGASNSIYTLRVYSGKGTTDIKAKDEGTYSVNFRLNGENMTEPETKTGLTRSTMNKGSGLGKVQSLLEDRIAEKMIASLDQEPEEAPSKLGIIGEILDHPIIGNIVERVAVNWLTSQTANIPPEAMPSQMRAVGNIATDADLVKAIERLKKCDPKLTEHLTKLADMAERDPATFAMVVGSLDKM